MPRPLPELPAANFSLPGRVKITVPKTFSASLAAALWVIALYFAYSRFLPPAAHHKVAGFDLGLVVDFWL
jgi:hypothetical protein